MTSKQAIIGLVGSSRQAERILTALEGAGLSKDDVSVLLSAELEGSPGDVAGLGRGLATAIDDTRGGSTSGGALARHLGVGVIAIPGAGSFIGAGPVFGALSEEFVGGRSRGIAAALIQMGTREPEAQQYEGKIRAGRVLVAVHVDEHEELALAKAILREGRAQDISSVGDPTITQLQPSTPGWLS